jgi:hypothetical protein
MAQQCVFRSSLAALARWPGLISSKASNRSYISPHKEFRDGC